MVNPILEMLHPNGRSNNIMSVLSTVKNIMSGGNPSQIVQAEMQNNPRFAQFVKEHQNMTVNDLISQTGVDPAMLNMLLK